MREIEVLHDNLLQMFATDRELQPRDILVMTPDIETYSAYILLSLTPRDESRRTLFDCGSTVGRTASPADALFAILDLAGTTLHRSGGDGHSVLSRHLCEVRPAAGGSGYCQKLAQRHSHPLGAG